MKCLRESNSQILFFVNTNMYNFKIGFKFVKRLFKFKPIFIGKTSKVILFSKINRFLRLMTQGSIRTDLIKKIIIVI